MSSGPRLPLIEMTAQHQCPESNLLAAFVDGFIGDRDRQEIESHLDACADCRLAVADIARRTEAGPLDPLVPLVPGACVGRYRIVERLGAGGMGEVYRARDEQLDRDVAVKLLRRARGHDRAAQTRLRREARAMARTSHPNVLPVYDVGIHGGATYIAMRLVDGETLADRIASGVRWRDALQILLAAGDGLAAAHATGVVHRDFKPANVLLAATGEVFVADFGLAADDTDVRSSGSFPALDSEALTRSGLTMGTPAYMPPEQHGAGPLDGRADQYALCVCLYEALYGRRPFHASSLDELCAAKLVGPPSPPATDVPRWLWPLLRRGLQADRDDRWPTLERLLAALRRGRRRPARRWIAASAAAVALASAGWLLIVPDDVHRCAAARGRMQAVWSVQQRARVGAALRDAGAEPDVADGALHGVDAFVEAWNGAQTQACARSGSPAVASCLDEKLGELETTVELLAEANASEIAAMLSSVTALADPEACTTGTAPSASPGEAPIRLLIGKARALGRVGKFDEALAQAEAASALAREVGTAGLLAEVEVLRGTLLRAIGESERARDPLRFGYELAVLTGRWPAAAEAATALLSEHAQALDDLEGALRWAAMAEAALGEVDDLTMHGRFQCALGGALSEHGRLEESLEHERRGVELLADDPAAQGKCQVNIGIGLERLARYDEADQEVARGLEKLEASYGLAHRQVGKAIVVRGNLAMERGDMKRAREFYDRALAIALQTVGEEHEQTANVLENLANVQPGPEGIDTARRALEIRQRLTPGDSLRVARSMEQVGMLELLVMDFDAAAPLIEDSFAMKERLVGPEHITLIKSHELLTHLYAHTERIELAIEHARRGTAIARRVFPPGHLQLGRSLLIEGEILRGTEQRREAVPLVDEGVDIAQAHHPGDNGLLVDALITKGLLEYDLGEPARSIAPLERALVIADGGMPPTRGRPRLLMSLARSLLDGGGDRARAAAIASQAKEELGSSGREGDDTRVEIDRLIAVAAGRR